VSDEEAAFMATIRDHASDFTPRLVYADWLEERGVFDRGEYLRTVVEVANRSRQGLPVVSFADRLRKLAQSINRDWRERISFPYRVFLESFDPSDLITLVRLLRMKFGFNLFEAHDLTRKIPALLATVPTWEEAEEIKTNFEAGYWSSNPSGRPTARSVPICHIRIAPSFGSGSG
jgi:uncharacterized protein (TIGR02996 family)